ncbi:hypothetical protein V6N13_098036 [Hibiscus sabdariffa]
MGGPAVLNPYYQLGGFWTRLLPLQPQAKGCQIALADIYTVWLHEERQPAAASCCSILSRPAVLCLLSFPGKPVFGSSLGLGQIRQGNQLSRASQLPLQAIEKQEISSYIRQYSHGK